MHSFGRYLHPGQVVFECCKYKLCCASRFANTASRTLITHSHHALSLIQRTTLPHPPNPATSSAATPRAAHPLNKP